MQGIYKTPRPEKGLTGRGVGSALAICGIAAVRIHNRPTAPTPLLHSFGAWLGLQKQTLAGGVTGG